MGERYFFCFLDQKNIILDVRTLVQYRYRDDLTANIFESGPMPTPWIFLAGSPLLPSSKLG